MLDIAQSAPDFTLPDASGTDIRLSSLRGGCVVVYFYPRDDTSGCTLEALDFTARAADFAKQGVTVVGISKDSVAKHGKFIVKHNLGVTLLSDAQGTTCEDYGVWVEKSMYGRTFWGIERTTFLIDSAGKITNIWRKVKVPGHVDAVFSAVQP